MGDEAAAAEHGASAAEKYLRASAYYITAERMQSRTYEPRRVMYQTLQDTLHRAVAIGHLNCEWLEIPYDNSSYPALFVRGVGKGPRPCMVFCNGLDSVKEMVFLAIRDTFASRGISCLMVDQTAGVGESLRNRQMNAIVESERWASAAVDFLQRREDVDPARIGMMGWSLGGYYAAARGRV